MPPKRQTRKENSKRQLFSVLQDSTSSKAVYNNNNNNNDNHSYASTATSGLKQISRDVPNVNDWIKQMEKDLEKRIEGIVESSRQCKRVVHEAHYRGMCQISKAAKKMTVREFNAMHECNLLDMMIRNEAGVVVVVDAANDNTTKTTTTTAAAFNTKKRKDLETPAPKVRGGVPLTVSRTVRRGEVL